MAVQKGRMLSATIQTLIPRSLILSKPHNISQKVFWISSSSSRSVRLASTSHRDLAYSSPLSQSRRQYDEDEEEEYAVEDEHALQDLRRQHREDARRIHAPDETRQFAEYDLNKRLVKNLESLGYKEPFAIQSKTLQYTLEGRDVIGRAVTGSGKTMAFSIPIVQKIRESNERKGRSRNPKAIVISPTRELCMQIYRSIQELDSSVRCVAVYGGDSMNRQMSILRKGVDVICATPGRLNDHISRGVIGLDKLEFLCLDEADELLTPNFKDQIEDVLENSPESKQMMLFSATMPPDIKRITREYMQDPLYVDVSAEQKSHVPDNIKHLCIRLPQSQHLFAVSQLIRDYQAERCIVFMDTKIKAGDSAQILKRQGLKAEALHSDLSQSRREKIMSAFRKGHIRVLTATDVAARGLDVPECDLVIQVGVPKNGTDYYIHRSGRTGRGGRDGIAVLLHAGTYADNTVIKQISKLVKMEHCKLDISAFRDNLTSDILKKLNRVKQEQMMKSLETVKGLNMSPEQTEQMLASALELLIKGDHNEQEAKSHDPAFRRDSGWSRKPFDNHRNSTNFNRYGSRDFTRKRRNADDGDYF